MRWLPLTLALLPVSTNLADEKDDLVAKQRAFVMQTMKKCEVAKPALIETQDLIVCGPFAEEKLKTMGELVQKNYTAALKALKFEMTDNPPSGKLAIYFFPERKQYALFVGDVVNDRLAKDERCHIDAKPLRMDVAGALHQFRGERGVAAKGRKMPGEAEQVSPVAVRHEQLGQCARVTARQRRAERADPCFGGLVRRFLR